MDEIKIEIMLIKAITKSDPIYRVTLSLAAPECV